MPPIRRSLCRCASNNSFFLKSYSSIVSQVRTGNYGWIGSPHFYPSHIHSLYSFRIRVWGEMWMCSYTFTRITPFGLVSERGCECDFILVKITITFFCTCNLLRRSTTMMHEVGLKWNSITLGGCECILHQRRSHIEITALFFITVLSSSNELS